MLKNIVSNRVHEMRLTQANAAVDKQRVIGLGRLFSYSQRSGMGKAVAGTDDKGIKGVLGIQHTRVRLFMDFYSGLLRRLFLLFVHDLGCFRFGDKLDLLRVPVDLDQGVLDELGVLALQPVPSKFIGGQNGQRRVIRMDDFGGLKPRVETGLADLRLDDG